MICNNLNLDTKLIERTIERRVGSLKKMFFRISGRTAKKTALTLIVFQKSSFSGYCYQKDRIKPKMFNTVGLFLTPPSNTLSLTSPMNFTFESSAAIVSVPISLICSSKDWKKSYVACIKKHTTFQLGVLERTIAEYTVEYRLILSANKLWKEGQRWRNSFAPPALWNIHGSFEGWRCSCKRASKPGGCREREQWRATGNASVYSGA